MKTILICPGPSSAVPVFSETAPLSNLPMLGATLLEHWLSWLACHDAREVLVLAHDRPEQVQAAAGQGERWGLSVMVVEESRELTPAQVLLKHAAGVSPAPGFEPVMVLDRFPGQQPLFASYEGWFAAVLDWLPKALTPDRVGIRQVRPGVWVNSRAQVSSAAQLRGPCWVGRHAYVGPGAIIGPDTVIEDGSFIEPRVEVERSWVGPDTFVGRLARINHSLAWRDTLVNWRDGSTVKIPDPFLLSGLRRLRQPNSNHALTRLGEVYARNKAEAHLLWKQLLLHRGG